MSKWEEEGGKEKDGAIKHCEYTWYMAVDHIAVGIAFSCMFTCTVYTVHVHV